MIFAFNFFVFIGRTGDGREIYKRERKFL